MESKKKSPLRKCVGCGEMKDKRTLIRVVKEPDGNITIDKTGKKNGRGAYICDNPECLLKAKKSRRIEKSFKCQVSHEVYTMLEKKLSEASENR